MASLLDFFTGSGSYSGQQVPNSPEAASQGYVPNLLERFGSGLDRLQQYPGLPAMPMDEEERRRQRFLTLAQLGSTVARGGTLAEGLQGVQQQGLQRQLFQIQLNEQQRKLLEQQQLSQRMAALRQRLQGLPTEITPSMALAGGGGPTEQAAQMIGQRIPEDERQRMRADLLRGVASELALEPGGAPQAKALTELAQNISEVQKPTVLSPGARAVSATGRVIAEAPFAPKEPKQLSFEQRVLEDPTFATSPAGIAWLNIKKQIAAEGRPSVTVQTGETFAKEMAKGAAGQAQEQVAQGQSAASQIENSNRVRALLDQGVISGFGAEGRLKLGQAAQALGFNQNDPRIANTATLIPQLAQRTLNNASKMKGVLSDSDILLLTKVSNADISVGEAALRQALDISDRVDKEAIKRGRNAAQTILATPGMSQFAPLYQINEPKPYSKQVTVRGKSVTATQGTDGNYYVTVDGKRYRVEE
jgi:hypothetical protein